MELAQAPKQFCDNINLAFNEEFFLLVVSSGQEGTVYTLTPGHAKRFMQMLSHNIKKYEEQFGELHTQWSEDIPSPLQSGNMKGDNNKGTS